MNKLVGLNRLGPGCGRRRIALPPRERGVPGRGEGRQDRGPRLSTSWITRQGGNRSLA